METDFWDRCRACLNVDERKHNIFTDSYQGMSLQEILTLATSFQISVDDGLSPFLCRHCVNLVISFYNFKETYRKNENNIKALLLNLCVKINPDDCPLEEIVVGSDTTVIVQEEPEEVIDEVLKEYEEKEVKIRLKPDEEDIGFNSDKVHVTEEDLNDYEKREVKISPRSDIEDHGPSSDKVHITEENVKDYEEIEVIICLSSDEEDYSPNADDHATEDIGSRHEPNHKESDSLADTISFRPVENMEHRGTHKEKPKDIQCKICDKIFNCDDDYKDHVKSHKPNMCHICSTSFRRTWDLKQHIASHLDERAFVCKICGDAFKRRGFLTRHLNTHTDLRDYVCEHCGKAFKIKTTLNTHIRICHTKPLDCICTLCGAKFNLKSTLDKHMLRRHQNRQREFLCAQCPSEFKDKSSLKRHILVKHSNVKLFKPPCDVCGKEFWSFANLARHKKNVHDIIKKQRNKKSKIIKKERVPKAEEKKIHK